LNLRKCRRPGQRNIDVWYNQCYTFIMKTAISIPDHIFNKADELAYKLGISRSHLFTIAMKKYLEENNDKNITEKLNDIYSNNDNKMNPDGFFLPCPPVSRNKEVSPESLQSDLCQDYQAKEFLLHSQNAIMEYLN
jgi:hypothetical protein